jgi:hypothetical protein
MWYQKFDTYILGLGFTRSKEDHYVHLNLIGDHLIYLFLYVEDMLLIGNTKEIIWDVKNQLSSKFDMKDLSATNFILGMDNIKKGFQVFVWHYWLWFVLQRKIMIGHSVENSWLYGCKDGREIWITRDIQVGMCLT